MIHCGRYYIYVECALRYLPPEILDEHKDKLAIISASSVDVCRVARALCKDREIIVLSEHVLPKKGSQEDQADMRYFIFVVLHEIAHVVKKHRSPLFDNLSVEENKVLESEADELAYAWFNEHMGLRNNPHLKPITPKEVKVVQSRNKELMEKVYNNGFQAIAVDKKQE